MRSWTNNRLLIAVSVKGGWTRKHPLNTTPDILVFFRCPRIIPTLRPMCKSQIDNIKEIKEALPAQIRTVRTYNIPSKKCIGVVEISTRHTTETEEVLGHECLVYPYKKEEEVPYSMMFRILNSSLFAYPKIECSKNTENSSHTLHIVEMSNDIISHYFNHRIIEKPLLPKGLDSLFSKF